MSLPSRAVSLQHVPFEGAGMFATALQDRGVTLACLLVPQDAVPNDPGDLLLVMGGPMSANNLNQWIVEEIAFIQSALHARIPVVGVCLGSQLMAKALRATVQRGPAPEIGSTRVRLTDEGKKDPVFGLFPRSPSLNGTERSLKTVCGWPNPTVRRSKPSDSAQGPMACCST